ncbi:MAG: hypothetical protein E7161_04960 [Firmicutes bacterium]|nr:hypothetical protein [Bacillota bacterium]
MKSVPNIISTKDLSYLEDMLNWNFVLIKKINHYLDIIKDDDVYKTVSKIKEDLLTDYNNILNTLE